MTISTENSTKAFGQAITKLINKENLTRTEAKKLFAEILENRQTEMQQGAFLAALSAKGSTVEEIAGSWEAIFELDTVKVTPDINKPLVENCGTGMDEVNTFNISTAASIIAAAAGVVMAKHGARALTSTSGTIDILEELGVNVECEPDTVKKSIEKAGIGIFNGMSPKVHPRALGRILANISFGTILNTSASLANPALPQYGVRGVYSKELLNSVPLVMHEIGYKKAIVVHGLDENGNGMDEASTLGTTMIAELKEDGTVNYYSFEPEDLGLERAFGEDIKPHKDLSTETEALIKVLEGSGYEARQDITCLNSALIMYLMNITPTLEEGAQYSKSIIRSGKAIKKLEEWANVQA